MAVGARILRITEPDPGTTHEDCFEPEKPVLVTIQELATGVQHTISVCFDPTDLDPCQIVHLIEAGGDYQIDDAVSECGA